MISLINARCPEPSVIRREFGGCQKTRRDIIILAAGVIHLLSIRSGVRVPSGSPYLSRLSRKFSSRNRLSKLQLCWIVSDYAAFIARNSEGIRRVTLNPARHSDGAKEFLFSPHSSTESSCVRADSVSGRKGSARRHRKALGLRRLPRQADHLSRRRGPIVLNPNHQRGHHG